MKIHEYQAKALLRAFKIPLAQGGVAYTAEEASILAKKLGGTYWALKAQIHAGGRGKSGGIQLAHTLEDVKAHAKEMLGKTLVTPQTGPEGQKVRRVYVEQGCSYDRELYLGFLVDRTTQCVTVIGSSEGGVDIEAIASHSPEKIQRIRIHPCLGMSGYQARKLTFDLGLRGKTALKTAEVVEELWKIFMTYDASLLEINPLVITSAGEPLVLDVKMSFDPNALYRHPEVEDFRDLAEEDPLEAEATKHSLSYIKLGGNIGCLVNGAGLAMATMDAIKLYGGNPANFLDVGGGAPRERVSLAFKLILSDLNVEGILVNIFGGIMRCDILAEGIVEAVKQVGINVPLVIRLEGTNEELGQKILAQSGLPLISAHELGEAAKKIVQAVQEAA